MAQHLQEAAVLMTALRASRRKVMVFFFFVLLLVCVEGTVMYVLEHESKSGFTSIPESVYWAVVTITTVGSGDISPVTPLGKVMASIIMLTGFAIIAVPTGIVTSELGRGTFPSTVARRRCGICGCDEHLAAAVHCQQCGRVL